MPHRAPGSPGLMLDNPLMFNPNTDVNEVCAFILAGEKNAGVIGGGSLKNFDLQGQPTQAAR